MPQTVTKPRTKTRTKTQRPPLYKVILLNDDFTPREFVVQVLKAVFRMNAEHAYQVMMTAHRRGACVIAVYTDGAGGIGFDRPGQCGIASPPTKPQRVQTRRAFSATMVWLWSSASSARVPRCQHLCELPHQIRISVTPCGARAESGGTGPAACAGARCRAATAACTDLLPSFQEGSGMGESIAPGGASELLQQRAGEEF